MVKHIRVVKPKWIHGLCQNCSYSTLHMTLEWRGHQTLAGVRVHHNVSSLCPEESYTNSI